MNDLLNTEMVNDNLKKFDHSWEETVMELVKEPEADLAEGLYHRQLEKSTIMLNALALYSHQVHRKEPKSYSKLKAMVTHFSEDR